MAVLFALGSAVTIGIADIFGSLAGKPGRVLAPSLWILLIGAPGLIALGFLIDGDIIAVDMGYGSLAGFASASALLLLYTGYSRTSIGVVAPTTAVVGAAVPVGAGFVIDGAPSTLVVIGLGFGFAAILLIGWSPDGDKSSTRLALMLGVGSGIGFGIMAVCLGSTSEDSGVWPALATRAVAATTLAIGGTLMSRPRMPFAHTWKYIVPAAVLASIGVAMFTLAAQLDVTVAGLLVQGAFAVTVVGGVLLYGERSSVMQRVGFGVGAVSLLFVSLG